MKSKTFLKPTVLLLLITIMVLVFIKYTIPQKQIIARGMVFYGWQLSNLGMPKAAVFIYTVAICLDGNNYQAYVFRGDSYMKTGKYDDAMRDYLLTLNLKPGDEHSITSLNALYSKIYDYREANHLCELLMRIYPFQKDICYAQIGFNWFYLKDYQKALESYSMVKNPWKGNLYQYRIWTYLAIHEYDLALRDCEMAIKVDPKLKFLKNIMEQIPKDKERYANNLIEIDKLKDSLQINPNNRNAYIQMAGCYRDIGEYEKSVECYKYVIELNPPKEVLALALYGRGCLYYDNLGDTTRAIEDIKAAHEFGYEHADNWLKDKNIPF